MKKRERVYLLIRKASRNNKPCGQFPHFGARYPDACCIDGYLWDLDNCSTDGNTLYGGGTDPCPFCNTKNFVLEHMGNGWPVKQVTDYVLSLRKRYQ